MQSKLKVRGNLSLRGFFELPDHQLHNILQTYELGMIFGLQYLRGCAALWVMLFHFSAGIIPANMLENMIFHIFEYGFLGVDIFFMISGYIMCHSLHRKNQNIIWFLYKRYVRIYSGFWAVLSAFLLMEYFLNPYPKQYDLWKSYLLIPMPWEDTPFSIIWSLNFELNFYLLFVLVYFIPQNIRTKTLIMMLLSLVTMFSIHAAQGVFSGLEQWHGAEIYHHKWSMYVASPYIMEFVLGVVMYRYQRIFTIKKPLMLSLIAAIIGAIINETTFEKGYVMQGYSVFYRALLAIPFSGLLLNTAINAKVCKPNYMMKLIGDASYSLYLLHIPLLKLVQQNYDQSFLIKGTGQQLLFFSVICILLSIIWYKLIEKPFYVFLLYISKKMLKGGG